MNDLPSNLIPAHLLSWDKDSKTAVAEISFLCGNGCEFVGHDPVVDVKNFKTGVSKPFHYNHTDYADPSKEDIAGWKYISYINGVMWTLLIIND